MQDLQELIIPPIVLDRTEYPSEFSEVPEAIGDLEACSLLWHLPAFQIRYIPARPSQLLKQQIIAKEYDGSNACSLAVRLNMKYSQIKKIHSDRQEGVLDIDFFRNIYIAKVAEKCGSSVAIKLLNFFPGKALHIPRKGRNIMIWKLVNKEFSGANQVDLAVKYNISIACIYRFLKKRLIEIVPKKSSVVQNGELILDGIKCSQTTLF